jgi:lipopolysaccharide export system protein LptA
MRKRVTAVAIGAVLGLGAFAAAQAPTYTVRADRHISHVTLSAGINEPNVKVTQSTLTGNVVLQVNGVTVRADQAVIKDGEVTFEGNVRLTLPQSQ